MVFLADVYIPCEICGGKRYKPQTLEITYKGLNIRQVLDLTVDEAIRFFIKEDKLGQMLWQLQQVGLGYLRLGQPAPTLSGGEAQRLKIARELIGAGKKRGRSEERRVGKECGSRWLRCGGEGGGGQGWGTDGLGGAGL